MTTSRTFELRTYHAVPGRLPDLHARFRDHTIGLFRKHGMGVESFFTPTDGGDETTLVYLLSYESREAATAAWDAFRDDPEWIEVKANSEANGKIVAGLESLFLEPTDYSPLQ